MIDYFELLDKVMAILDNSCDTRLDKEIVLRACLRYLNAKEESSK